MTPDTILIYSFTVFASGLMVCVLALAVRGTVRVFMGKSNEVPESEHWTTRCPLPSPVPPAKREKVYEVPPASYSPPSKPPKQERD